MDHAEYWTPNNPHSPTHRSPELPQRTLTGIVMEQYNSNNASSGEVAPTPTTTTTNNHHHHHYYVQQERQQQQRQYRHSFVDEQEPHSTVRFQEQSPTTPGPTSAGDQPPAYDTTACYESTTTTSSLSTPLSSSGRPTRYAGDHLDELDFTRHGYYRHDDNDDQVERLRSTLSSLNTNSAWGSVWDGMVHTSIYSYHHFLHELSRLSTRVQDVARNVLHEKERYLCQHGAHDSRFERTGSQV